MKKIILLVWLLVFSIGSFSSEVKYKDEVKEYFVENEVHEYVQSIIWYYAAIEKYTGTKEVIKKSLYKLEELGILEKAKSNSVSSKGNYNDLEMIDKWREERNVKGMSVKSVPLTEKALKKRHEINNKIFKEKDFSLAGLGALINASRYVIVNNQMITTAHNHRKLGYFDFETESPWDLTGNITIFGTRKPIQYLNKTQALYIRSGKALIVTFKEQVSDGKAIAIVFGEPTEYTTALGVKKISATAYEL